MNEELQKALQGLNINGLVDKMSALQKQHITIAQITFDKTELKRAEPIIKDDKHCTKIVWKDGDSTIIEVSKTIFDKEFNK